MLSSTTTDSAMKMYIVLGSVLIWTLLVASKDTLENCSCWDGYKPGVINDSIECVGIVLRTHYPCNLPKRPKCICTKYKVTSILTDKDGTFCSTTHNGVEQRRWDCENKDMWEEYKKEVAKYEKGHSLST